MITYHGWLKLDTNGSTTEQPMSLDTMEADGSDIMEKINQASTQFSLVTIEDAGDGMGVLVAHGVKKNEKENVLDLFKWASAAYPGSYGLLHVRDQCDGSSENTFKVYRFAQGECTEMEDPHLSPCIPTIEKPKTSSTAPNSIPTSPNG